MGVKPRVFIGSSVESLSVAYAIQQELEHATEPTVWTQGIFEPSSTSMQSLLKALSSSDAAIFVFAPDDVVKMRKQDLSVVRDNVVFELGLFVGRLGMDRVFFLVPRDASLHLPTDLLGVTPLRFDSQRSDGNHRAAVGPACDQLRRQVEALAARERPNDPPSVNTANAPPVTAALAARIAALSPLDAQVEVLGRAYSGSPRWRRTTTWAELFARLAPTLMQSQNEATVSLKIGELFDPKARMGNLSLVDQQCFETIKIQLIAHGLISVTEHPTTAGGTALFWRLTELGSQTMLELRAVRAQP